MTKYLDVMVDLETLATDPRALIVSLGAVFFNADGLGKTFYAVLDKDEQQRMLRTVSDSTLEWWSKQGDAAQAVLSEPGESVAKILLDFASWMGIENVRLWGNGATFDNVVLATLYEDYDIKRPWGYTNDRCYRTLRAVSTYPGAEPVRQGTYHNALDDAVYQAECAIRLLKGNIRW